MAWIKVPAEHHPLFLAAVPKERRVTTMRMFGGIAALMNGHIFAGLFARSVIVRLSPDDQRLALALEGAGLFDPMGNGRTMTDTVLLPEDVIDDADELRSWLDRALAFAATKRPKPPKGLAKPAKRAKPTKVVKPSTRRASSVSGAKATKAAKPTTKRSMTRSAARRPAGR